MSLSHFAPPQKPPQKPPQIYLEILSLILFERLIRRSEAELQPNRSLSRYARQKIESLTVSVATFANAIEVSALILFPNVCDVEFPYRAEFLQPICRIESIVHFISLKDIKAAI